MRVVNNTKPPATASDIHKNRLSFCKKLIDNNIFDLGIYATYFEIPRKRAESDLSLLGYKVEDVSSKNPISLQKLVAYRDNILESYGKNDQDYMNQLYKMGYWHKPENNSIDHYDYENKNYQLRFQQAVAFYQNELRVYNSREVAHKFDLDTEEFDNYVKENDLHRYGSKLINKYTEELKDILQFSTVKSVSDLTGSPTSTFLDLSRSISKGYIDTHKDLIGEHTPGPRAYLAEQRRQRVWEMYNQMGSTHGMTMQEIADELHITRVTVSSDIKTYKKEHPEVIDHSQLYQPRHLGYDKTVARNERKAEVASLYKKGKTIIDISKITKIRYDVVSLYLQEDGLIPAYKSAYFDKKKQHDITKDAIKGYVEKGQFTVFKTNNEGNVTAFHGATSHLLDEADAPSYSTNYKERDRVRAPILRNQQKTMAIIRNDPVAYMEFMSQKGDMSKYMINKEVEEFERKHYLESQKEPEMELV